MKIGNYKLDIVQTGFFGLDGGAMFGVVPKTLWNRTNPADDANRIELAMRALLVQGEDKVILVDTGIGEQWPNKFKSMFAIDHARATVEGSLQKLGLSTDSVTDVILTHLHFDHAGGAMYQENDTWLPRFKNATYYVQKRHFAHAQNPLEKDRASFIETNFMPLKESGKLELVDGPGKLFPGIETIVVDGHTVGQQLLKISDANTTLFYCADLIPTSSHIPVPYVMSYDLYPVTTIEEKKKYLSKAVAEEWYLFLEHDPKVALTTVKQTKKGFIAGEVFSDLTEIV